MTGQSTSVPEYPEYDALVVGAGFGGLYALYQLRAHGFSCHAFETGDDVGGTWYWNRYPGARCDVESLDYCYSFSPELHAEWDWTERFATQPEILRYAGHVADRFDLRPMISFGTRVVSAVWEEGSRTWLLTTGDGRRARARFLVTAVGCLSASRVPDLPGLDAFRGEVHHTGRWPHAGVDLADKRVAVIGTGSSGIQAIPELAAHARHLTVFQRTPNYSLPARNRPLSGRESWRAKTELEELRSYARTGFSGFYIASTGSSALDVGEEERRAAFERKWAIGGTEIMSVFTDVLTDGKANEHLAEFVREKIRDAVDDPATARKLVPLDYPIGTKRICVDSGYFTTYNRENVDLVDLRAEPLVEITEDGIRTEGGTYPAEVLVLATGYDAMTGPLTRIDVRGTDGRSLKQQWSSGPRTYLGLAVAGFPNLLTVTGPGSPSVLVNMVRAVEQHVDWIVDCLRRLREDGVDRIEARPEAQDSWVAHVNEVADTTLYPRADSWYVGANVEGKARVFMPYAGGLSHYRERCEEVARSGYRGFALGPEVSA
ncbi:NAD(P)/FAD-dependent oxidoreductase [Streptomyces sp. NPDC048295]|uniref:flavin-containing monooxygenase n=1 Tax=Streptomyces sp. NPDC048295 TaxID=3154617 RepID=UPI003413E2A9